MTAPQQRVHVRNDMPAATTDLDQAKRDMDETGLAIMRGLFTPEQVAALRERVLEQAELEREQGVAFFADPALGPHPRYGRDIYHQAGTRVGKPAKTPPFQNVRFLPNKGQVFIELAQNPALLAMGEHTLGTEFNVGSMVGLIVRKGAPAQVIHRDQSVLPFETPQPAFLNLMVALGPYKPEHGSTRVIPGTHLGEGPRYERDEFNQLVKVVGSDVEPVASDLEPGDVLFFESRVWHGQGEPVSDEDRISISIIYNAHWWRPHDNYPAILSDEVYRGMTEDQRALFGFKIYNHGSGAVAPRYPGDPRHNILTELPFVPELRRDSDQRAEPLNGEVEVW